jgi:hypothetical protein
MVAPLTDNESHGGFQSDGFDAAVGSHAAAAVGTLG